jgi:hypothetical protein
MQPEQLAGRARRRIDAAPFGQSPGNLLAAAQPTPQQQPQRRRGGGSRRRP